jgi:hypothetical protein
MVVRICQNPSHRKKHEILPWLQGGKDNFVLQKSSLKGSINLEAT